MAYHSLGDLSSETSTLVQVNNTILGNNTQTNTDLVSDAETEQSFNAGPSAPSGAMNGLTINLADNSWQYSSSTRIGNTILGTYTETDSSDNTDNYVEYDSNGPSQSTITTTTNGNDAATAVGSASPWTASSIMARNERFTTFASLSMLRILWVAPIGVSQSGRIMSTLSASFRRHWRVGK